MKFRRVSTASAVTLITVVATVIILRAQNPATADNPTFITFAGPGFNTTTPLSINSKGLLRGRLAKALALPTVSCAIAMEPLRFSMCRE